MTAKQKMRHGYKETEIGVMPKDWEPVPMISITSDIGDGIHTTPAYSGLGEYYFINGNNLSDGHIVITAETKTVSQSEFKKHRQNLSNRSILMSINGTIGNLGLFNGEGVILGKSAAYLNVKDSVSKAFVYYSIQTQAVKRQFLDGITGTTIGNLGLCTIRRTKIPLPSTRTEQKTIANTLRDTDAVIQSIEQLIVKKRAIKQGVMQELLTGKRRLPGFSGKWETRLMGKLGKPYGGLSGKSKDDFQDGKYPYIPFLNILNNPVIDTIYFDYVNIKPGENQNRVQKGDLFFNGSSETPEEVGMCSVLLVDVPNLYLNSFCFGFRLNNEINTSGLYLSYFFRSDVGRKLIYFLAQGATRHNLSKNSFMKLEVLCPSYKEQVAIAQVFSDIDAEIKQLEQKLVKYRMIKQGMMQVLLSGRIRLV